VRRELWENRSIYIAPLIAAGVVIFGFSLSAIGMPHRRLATLALPAEKQTSLVAMPYEAAAIAIMITMVVVGMFYSLAALHNERRDRSILFWKSLPVSNLTTVLSKIAVPLLVMPPITFATILATQLLILVESSIILTVNGVPALTPGAPNPIVQTVVLLYGLITMTLWQAPVYGWLLLVSGWARRTPFLWAILPPLAICLIEKLAFNSAHFAHMLGSRISGGSAEGFTRVPHAPARGEPAIPVFGLDQLDPGRFIASPGLWLGLAFAAACVAGAIWLRRSREPA
jgi:ABC-2 type transport system permease protein